MEAWYRGGGLIKKARGLLLTWKIMTTEVLDLAYIYGRTSRSTQDLQRGRENPIPFYQLSPWTATSGPGTAQSSTATAASPKAAPGPYHVQAHSRSRTLLLQLCLQDTGGKSIVGALLGKSIVWEQIYSVSPNFLVSIFSANLEGSTSLQKHLFTFSVDSSYRFRSAPHLAIR